MRACHQHAKAHHRLPAGARSKFTCLACVSLSLFSTSRPSNCQRVHAVKCNRRYAQAAHFLQAEGGKIPLLLFSLPGLGIVGQ